MVDTIYSCIILHNMIVEARRDGYQSEFFQNALEAVECGLFIDEQGVEKPFSWRSKIQLSQITGHEVSEVACAKMLDVREREITDEAVHFSLKKRRTDLGKLGLDLEFVDDRCIKQSL